MTEGAIITALLAVVLNTGAAGLGAWRWWRVEPSDAFWVLVRAGQGASILLALFAGVAFLSGARPDDDLYWLYAVLPVAVGFFAEQFRILSAQTVLDARGLEDVGAKPLVEGAAVVGVHLRRDLVGAFDGQLAALHGNRLGGLALRCATGRSKWRGGW